LTLRFDFPGPANRSYSENPDSFSSRCLVFRRNANNERYGLLGWSRDWKLMSKGQHTLKQGNLTRAVKGAVKAGLSVQRIKFDREGNFELITGRPDQEPDEENEWDSVK
jgi:hypothetical protein